MKKLLILSIILILGLSLVAYTASMKLDFYWFDDVTEDGEPAVGCFAIVNYTPKDAANVENENDTVATIQIQVRGLDPETKYEVWSKSVLLGDFTTNKKGSGSWHDNVTIPAFEDLPRRLNIKLDGSKVLWTGVDLF